MDPDWEAGMWNGQGLVDLGPRGDAPYEVLEEGDDARIVRTPLGAVVKEGTAGSSIPHTLTHALEPTRESWNRFRAFLDPSTPQRRPAGWEEAADAFAARERVATFLAGSLYGWPRDWMGVEGLSYLPYDDPALLDEMVEHLTDYFIELWRPVLARTTFDFAYIFEDCCFNTGPLLSPEIYRRHYDRHYRRLVEFYHSMGVRYVMLDSDGKVDALIPAWLDSGIDIIFPIEVGTWLADPVDLRRRFGKGLRMIGGIDKHVIPRGREAIRAHLESRREVVEEGGYVALPDHRIPPDCSRAQFETYVEVFTEVFARRRKRRCRGARRATPRRRRAARCAVAKDATSSTSENANGERARLRRPLLKALRIQPVGRLYECLGAEDLAATLAPALAVGMARLFVGGKEDDGLGQAGDVARFDQRACNAVLDDLGRAVDVEGDHRPRGEQRLYEDARQALAEAGVHQ
jgi:uroporphyrinogen decarboxylase